MFLFLGIFSCAAFSNLSDVTREALDATFCKIRAFSVLGTILEIYVKDSLGVIDVKLDD